MSYVFVQKSSWRMPVHHEPPYSVSRKCDVLSGFFFFRLADYSFVGELPDEVGVGFCTLLPSIDVSADNGCVSSSSSSETSNILVKSLSFLHGAASESQASSSV
eukprot:2649080-Amphidinium_carterae.2